MLSSQLLLCLATAQADGGKLLACAKLSNPTTTVTGSCDCAGAAANVLRDQLRNNTF